MSANREASLWLCKGLAIFAALSAVAWAAAGQWLAALVFGAMMAGLGLTLQVATRDRDRE